MSCDFNLLLLLVFFFLLSKNKLLLTNLNFRAYIESLIKNLEQKVTLDGLFDNVRGELSQRKPEVSSLPLEFSLTSSLLPFRLNPGDSKG